MQSGGAFLGAISRPWKIYPATAGMQHRAGWASLPPAAARKKKERRKANFCASMVVKVSFFIVFSFPFLFPFPSLFLFFLFLGIFYLCLSALFLSLGQSPGELVRCCCCAWGCSLSVLSPWEGGKEGWRGSLAEPFATAFAELGGNLGLSSACSAFNPQLFGAKSRVFNSPSPAQLIFEVIFERFGAPRRNPRSRFFKTWHHAHPNHWH